MRVSDIRRRSKQLMGAGGGCSMSVFQSKKEEQDHHLLRRRAPHSKPPFTLSQIKKAIPPHCFNRSVLRSFSYLVYDITIASILYYLATTYIPLLTSNDHMISVSFVAWAIYVVVQGCVFTGVWVIGHECGHNAFSDYQWLNDIVGLVLHSALLVPYFSFKYSHGRHHSNNGSLEHDEVFVPKPKSELSWFSKYLNNPPGRVLTLAITLICGWSSYLAFNVSGRPYERFASHFDPHGPIFSDRERLQIYLSDAGFLTTVYVLYCLVALKGLAWVACVYGFPLLVFNAFIVLITYLQHTHPVLPHYDSSEWNFLRGALATMDRDYGILNKVFHNITDTHVAHHLFSTIPHYHAMEAMKAIKPVLGDYYQFDGTLFYKAMWRVARECLYVAPDEGKGDVKGIYWYNNKL